MPETCLQSVLTYFDLTRVSRITGMLDKKANEPDECIDLLIHIQSHFHVVEVRWDINTNFCTAADESENTVIL